jgi:hypothetical protein
MNNGVVNFFKGCLSMHPVWRVWLFILFLANVILPCFFLNHTIAQVSLLCAFSGALIGFSLTHVNGFNKLLGLMHGPWIPLVFLQGKILYKLTEVDPAFSNFSKWLIFSFAVSSISLVIDITDVLTYLRQNKHK